MPGPSSDLPSVRRAGSSISALDVERFRTALRRAPTHQGRFEQVLRGAIRAWCRLAAWNVEVTVRAPLPVRVGGRPGAGCVVAVAPHRAWLEPFLLVAAWPPEAARLVWIGDGRTMTESWWRRRLLPRLGAIPISGGIGAPPVYAELVREALAAGAALAVFPERGPPAAADRTRTISPGFAYLARRAGAPIVPVVVGGTHHIVRGSAFTLDILEAINVGEPDPDPFRPEARRLAHDLARRFEAEVAAVLPDRTAQLDARRPARDRWRWLATLLD